MSPSLEELQQKLEELQSENAALKEKEKSAAAKVESLERSKTALQQDITVLKPYRDTAKAAFAAAGLDPDSEESRSRFFELLRNAGSRQDSESQASPESGGGQAPSDAVVTAMKAQLSSLTDQVANLRQEKERSDQQIKQEREQRLADKKKFALIGVLNKFGVDQELLEEFYVLTEKDFRLNEDGVTLLWGTDDDPLPADDAVAKFANPDHKYRKFFNVPSPSGSDLVPSRPGPTVTDRSAANPFTKSASNATDASYIISQSPARAKQLAALARQRNDADETLCKLAEGRLR